MANILFNITVFRTLTLNVHFSRVKFRNKLVQILIIVISPYKLFKCVGLTFAKKLSNLRNKLLVMVKSLVNSLA